MTVIARLKRLITLGSLAGALAGAAAVPARAETFNLRLASGHAPGFHFVDVARQYFVPELKKRVAERTSHRINVLEAYGGTLAKFGEVLDATQSGVVDLGLFCICHVSGKLRAHNFPFYLPFGPTDAVISVKATRKVYDSVPFLNEQLEKEYGQRLLALIPFDPYDLISVRPIQSPADLSGRKIAGAGPNLPWVERLGATPVTTTGGEVYTSMQSRVYEGILGFVSLMDAQKLYDVSPNYTQVGFGAMTILALHVNAATLAKLPPEVRAILIETARDFETRAAEYTRDLYEKRIGEIAQRGAKVSVIDADQKQKWAEALQPWTMEKAAELDKAGLPGTAMLKAYVAAAAELGHRWPVSYGFK